MFYLSLAIRKNFFTRAFLGDLAPTGLIVDARAVTPTATRRYLAQARGIGAEALVDPVNYFDQSPKSARPDGYGKLPYGVRNHPLTSVPNLATYVPPIVSHQLSAGVTSVIAPYFYAEPGSLPLIDASLLAAEEARREVARKQASRDVWTAVAVSQSVLTTTAALSHLRAAISKAKPETLYLVVAASQATAAPLGDKTVLEGFEAVIDAARAYGGKVVLGRRYVSGLLGLGLGAAGWSTGVSGTHQNFIPPPASKPKSGGKGADWIFIPRLLNSLRLSTRAALVGATTTVALTDPYAQALFAGAPRRATLNTAQGALLHQHNLYAMRALAQSVEVQPASQRRAHVKALAQKAKADYATLNRAWVSGEEGAFLDSWIAVL